jgi:hypothetical protein
MSAAENCAAQSLFAAIATARIGCPIVSLSFFVFPQHGQRPSTASILTELAVASVEVGIDEEFEELPITGASGTPIEVPAGVFATCTACVGVFRFELTFHLNSYLDIDPIHGLLSTSALHKVSALRKFKRKANDRKRQSCDGRRFIFRDTLRKSLRKCNGSVIRDQLD